MAYMKYMALTESFKTDEIIDCFYPLAVNAFQIRVNESSSHRHNKILRI